MARRAPFFSRDLAVDLGTANTVIYQRGAGIVLDEPSVVAVSRLDGRPVAVGTEAKEMLGRTPEHIIAERPLKDGVISDFDLCEEMLRRFMQRLHLSRLARPRVIICVPGGTTGVEQRAVMDAAESAGARHPVYVIDEPMAAAIGAGLPVALPQGNMVVDIGGGTTEVAVISLGGVVASASVRTGGDSIDAAIAEYCASKYSFDIGERTSEILKKRMGSACPLQEEVWAKVKGRDLATGLPREIMISTIEVREAIAEPVARVIDAVTSTLDQTPPELAADLMDNGVSLSGGGALLRGLDVLLYTETGMPIHVAEDPLRAVARGVGIVLEDFDSLKDVLISSDSM